MQHKQIKIWDPLVRIFHWSLVALFILSYATEDDFLNLHVNAGYIITGLIMFRLVWGFIGSRHARFSDFVKSPNEIKTYLVDVMLFRAKRYLGHNPAGGAMVIALLVSLFITIVTGMLTYGATEFSGPLAVWTSTVSDQTAHLLEETHELFANFTLLLVLLHVAGVTIASLQHSENLVSGMIDGYKRAENKPLDHENTDPTANNKEATQ